MLIDTMTGNQNFPGQQAKAHVFITPCAAHPGDPDKPGEHHIYAAANTGAFGLRKVRGGGRIPAAAGLGDQFGSFSETTYEVPDGVILKLFASKKRPQDSAARACSQFFRSRGTGPLVRLELPLLEWASNATVHRAFVEGRFDLLSLEEAENFGVKVMPLSRRLFFPTVVDAVLTRRVIAPETRAAAIIETRTVQNSQGESVTVETRARGRIIDVW